MPDDRNKFLGGTVYGARTGQAAVIWTLEDGVHVMAILFCDDQVLAHCSYGQRRNLFTDEEWERLEGVLGDLDALPLHVTTHTPEPIVIRGSAAETIYLRQQAYARVTQDEGDSDQDWHNMPPRMIGFLFLDSIGAARCNDDYSLILAMKINARSYRVFICYTSQQVRAVLDAHRSIGFDRDFYERQLTRAILNDGSQNPMITIGEGPSATVAYHIGLWIEVNRLYGQGRRASEDIDQPSID